MKLSGFGPPKIIYKNHGVYELPVYVEVKQENKYYMMTLSLIWEDGKIKEKTITGEHSKELSSDKLFEILRTEAQGFPSYFKELLKSIEELERLRMNIDIKEISYEKNFIVGFLNERFSRTKFHFQLSESGIREFLLYPKSDNFPEFHSVENFPVLNEIYYYFLNHPKTRLHLLFK